MSNISAVLKTVLLTGFVALTFGGGWAAFKSTKAAGPATTNNGPVTSSATSGVAIGTVNGNVITPTAPVVSPNTSIPVTQLGSILDTAREYGQTEQKLEQSQSDVATWREQATEWRYLYVGQAAPRAIDMLKQLAQYPQYHPTVDQFANLWQPAFGGSNIAPQYAINQILAEGGWISEDGGTISVTPEGLHLLNVFHQMPTIETSANSTIPSFDCSKASSQVELTICKTPELAQLDEQATSLYLKWRDKSQDIKSAINDQAAWRRTYRDTCENVACIQEAYSERVKELAARLSQLPP